jgi:hypothetical protein
MKKYGALRFLTVSILIVSNLGYAAAEPEKTRACVGIAKFIREKLFADGYEPADIMRIYVQPYLKDCGDPQLEVQFGAVYRSLHRENKMVHRLAGELEYCVKTFPDQAQDPEIGLTRRAVQDLSKNHDILKQNAFNVSIHCLHDRAMRAIAQEKASEKPGVN